MSKIRVESTLVILTRNEISGMTALIDKIPFSQVDEAFVVDYKSSDGTKEFVRQRGLKLINQGKPGRGEAFRLAVAKARGKYLVFFSPDGNEDPQDIPKLLHLLKQGNDLVIASRFLPGSRNEEDNQCFKFRAWANQTFTILANLLWGGRLSDSINGYRAISKEAFGRLRLDASGYAIEYQMSIRALKLKLKIAEIATKEGNRLGGQSGSKAIPTGLFFLRLLLKEISIGKKPSNNYTDLFFELVRTDFKMRYHNSILGFFWVLLKPFLIFLILLGVFSWVFKTQDPQYPLRLLLGILLYGYFAEGTLQGLTSLVDKSNIILKVNFPKTLALLSPIVNAFISFFFGFLVYLVFWVVQKPTITVTALLYFFWLILILSLLIVGLVFFLSVIYTRLRDLKSIWEVILQLIFYATPIIYPLTVIPLPLRVWFKLNPLTLIVVQGQALLIKSDLISLSFILYAQIVALGLFIFGYQFFQKNVKRVAENF